MIKVGTILKSNYIKKVKCISINCYSKKHYYSIGDIITVVPYKIHLFKNKNSDIKKGMKFYGIISATRYRVLYKDGRTVRFPYNYCIIVKKKNVDLKLVPSNLVMVDKRIDATISLIIKKKYPNLEIFGGKFI